jgi:hypothetical protein
MIFPRELLPSHLIKSLTALSFAMALTVHDAYASEQSNSSYVDQKALHEILQPCRTLLSNWRRRVGSADLGDEKAKVDDCYRDTLNKMIGQSDFAPTDAHGTDSQ